MTGFGLFIQQLNNARFRVLVLCHYASFRNENGWFSPSDIRKLFDLLRVPSPKNIYAIFNQLKAAELLLHHRTRALWSLTPKGRLEATGAAENLDFEMIQAEMTSMPGAEFGFVRHSVIPPEFAPPRWLDGISQLLDVYDFEKNVFCMTRFPESNSDTTFLDPVNVVIEIAREVLSDHGLNMHLASDQQLDDELFGNVGAHMWACRYGLGLLENRAGRGLNHNVVTELGGMLVTGRRCALLKDKTTPDLPTDLAGHIYKSVDFDDHDMIAQTIHSWAADDLALGSCKNCI